MYNADLHYTMNSALHYSLCVTLQSLHYTMPSVLHYNCHTTLQFLHYTMVYTTEMCVITTIVTGIVARDDAREFSTSCGNLAPKNATTLCVTVSRPNLIDKILFLRNCNTETEGKITKVYSTGKYTSCGLKLYSTRGNGDKPNICFLNIVSRHETKVHMMKLPIPAAVLHVTTTESSRYISPV